MSETEIDFSKYTKEESRIIKQCLDKGIDINLILHQRFNWRQMYEIMKGVEAGVDITIFNNPKLKSEQMEQIRYGLMDGTDAAIYADPYFSSAEMNTIRRALKLLKERDDNLTKISNSD